MGASNLPDDNDDAVAEGRRRARGELEVQLVLAVREDLLPERVRGEEAVAAGVPVGRRPGVLGMVEDGEGHVLLAESPGKGHPAAPCPPDLVALLALAAVVEPGDPGVVQHGHRGRPALGVGVGPPSRCSDARARGPARRPRRPSLLSAKATWTRRGESRVVRSMIRVPGRCRGTRRSCPRRARRRSGITHSVATASRPSAGPPLASTIFRCRMRPILACCSGGKARRVVPEVDAVDVAVAQEQAHVVRMVGALAGPRVEGKPAGDGRALRGEDRIEDGLGQRLGPDVGR